MRWLAKLNENNDEDDKIKTEIKGHNNIKKIWKMTQNKRTKEKK